MRSAIRLLGLSQHEVKLAAAFDRRLGLLAKVYAVVEDRTCRKLLLMGCDDDPEDDPWPEGPVDEEEKPLPFDVAAVNREFRAIAEEECARLGAAAGLATRRTSGTTGPTCPAGYRSTTRPRGSGCTAIRRTGAGRCCAPSRPWGISGRTGPAPIPSRDTCRLPRPSNSPPARPRLRPRSPNPRPKSRRAPRRAM